MLIPSLLRTSIDRLLPGCCALCGGDGPGPLCTECSTRLTGEARDVDSAVDADTPLALSANPERRCDCCALRLPPDLTGHICHCCAQSPPSFDRTIVLADYAPPLDRLMLDLKFRACLPLAQALGGLLARKVMNTIAANAPAFASIIAPGIKQQATLLPSPRSVLQSEPQTILLPVPLSLQRLAERGFNQAHEIARPLATALQLKIASGLCVRVRHTEAQASLPLAERRVNMRSAFAVLRPQAIAGKAVLVVDDVMTTGHTLEALAACLKRHGATHVINLVIARTPAR